MYTQDWKEDMQCPYNEAHVVSKRRYMVHIMNCKKQNPHIEMATCIYNVGHVMKPEEMERHLKVCESKHRLFQSMYKDDFDTALKTHMREEDSLCASEYSRGRPAGSQCSSAWGQRQLTHNERAVLEKFGFLNDFLAAEAKHLEGRKNDLRNVGEPSGLVRKRFYSEIEPLPLPRSESHSESVQLSDRDETEDGTKQAEMQPSGWVKKRCYSEIEPLPLPRSESHSESVQLSDRDETEGGTKQAEMQGLAARSHIPGKVGAGQKCEFNGNWTEQPRGKLQELTAQPHFSLNRRAEDSYRSTSKTETSQAKMQGLAGQTHMPLKLNMTAKMQGLAAQTQFSLNRRAEEEEEPHSTTSMTETSQAKMQGLGAQTDMPLKLGSVQAGTNKTEQPGAKMQGLAAQTYIPESLESEEPDESAYDKFFTPSDYFRSLSRQRRGVRPARGLAHSTRQDQYLHEGMRNLSMSGAPTIPNRGVGLHRGGMGRGILRGFK